MAISMANLPIDKNTRHVLGISGGKDSAALAIYIKERYPDVHAKVEYLLNIL